MIEFQILNPTINGFTERKGGVSKEPFDSFNLGFNSGDEQEDVEENLKILMTSIACENRSIYYMDQVHGNHIENVDRVIEGFHRVPETDGIITNKRDVLLISTYADCVPLLFYCDKMDVVGLAHSGWKGTLLEISKKMVQMMEKEYGVSSNDIKVAIGPAAGQCCYEVDSKVYKSFSGYEKYSEYVDEDHVMLDLRAIIVDQLIDCGLNGSNIECSTLCTICNPHRFCSYRRSHPTGRMVSFIGLK